MKKEVIVTSKAPQPITHNPQAIKVGPYVFVSGLYATDFKTGIPVRSNPIFPFAGPTDIELQTEYILKNLSEILQAAGSRLNNVVKTEVFLEHPKYLAGLDRVWREFFPKDPPARTTIEVGPHPLIPGALVEVYAIGIVPDGTVRKQVIQPAGVPTPTEHCSPAVRAGSFLFLAGQVATDFKTPVYGVHPRMPYYGSDIEVQTEYVLRNLKELLEHCGSSLEHVVDAHIYLLDTQDYRGFERVYRRMVPEPPVIAVIPSTGIMFDGPVIEVDFIATRGR